ncbi:MAG TPA: indole-3-glycerol phosphate synthase TrpC [Candidatus Binataceae bacterium]|nr:indole-3-glycerol phosphate synthase TrpC [Candidatus Binataceae bacterium]
MSSILDRIFAAKREELRERQQLVSRDAIAAAARGTAAPRDIVAALRARRPAIIAEVKRASPSKGDIMPGLDPATVGRDYASSGAAAISVLTDRHFKGSLEDLRTVRAAVDLPLLRKDFIFDDYQLFEARAAGADCILLIAAMLTQGALSTLAEAARKLGLAALIEVHNRAEFARAAEMDAELIGINNRDLHTFKTDIALTEQLLEDYRGPALIVAESGIETPAQIARLDRAGASAFLIGESLLRGGNPRVALAALAGALGESARVNKITAGSNI